jgi:uncharacterized protein
MPKASKTSFFEAAKRWRAQEVAAALRERPDFASIVDNRGRTALHVCARPEARSAADRAAALATAKALVKAGADINAVQPIRDGQEVFPAMPLWYAVAFGKNRPLATFLLKRKADPNHCLFAMVYADDLPSAKLLRSYGARLDDKFDGETPLIYAARHRRAKLMEWLLREGADANVRDGRGFTALHHAVRRRLPDATLRALLERGADPRAVSQTGVSVADLATRAQKRLFGLDV